MSGFNINSRQVKIQLIRSSRKTLAVEITRQGEVLVRAPYWMPEAEIHRFVQERKSWIADKLRQMELREEHSGQAEDRLSQEEIKALADQALKVIPARAAHFAPLVGVTYGRITIRNQKSRWGSCSEKGNLNFNCLLMLTPPEVIDYVVVHELCHRIEMNHSKKFWAEVERVLPDYKVRERWLKENGKVLIRRMIG